MLDELADSLNIDRKLFKASIAILIIAIVYEVSPSIGWLLGGLAILAILTQK